MDLLALLLAVSVSYSLIFTFFVSITSWLFGAPILEIGLFAGPRRTLARIGGARLTVGLIPFGGFAKFVSLETLEEALVAQDSDEANEIVDDIEGHQQPEFAPIEPKLINPLFSRAQVLEDLHPIRRVAIHLGGYLGIVASCICVLGFQRCVAAIASGYTQVLFGALDKGYASELISHADSLLNEGAWLVCAAILGCKLLAVDFWPVPFMTGGVIIRELVSSVFHRRFVWPQNILTYSFIIVVIVALIWANAILSFLFD